MTNYVESEIISDGLTLVLRRVSLGVYNVSYNDIIAYSLVDSNFETYNKETKLIVGEVKRLTKLEKKQSNNHLINSLDNESTVLGVFDCRFKLRPDLHLKMKNISTTKVRFINEAIAEKLIKEGLL